MSSLESSSSMVESSSSMVPFVKLDDTNLCQYLDGFDDRRPSAWTCHDIVLNVW